MSPSPSASVKRSSRLGRSQVGRHYSAWHRVDLVGLLRLRCHALRARRDDRVRARRPRATSPLVRLAPVADVLVRDRWAAVDHGVRSSQQRQRPPHGDRPRTNAIGWLVRGETFTPGVGDRRCGGVTSPRSSRSCPWRGNARGNHRRGSRRCGSRCCGSRKACARLNDSGSGGRGLASRR